MDIFANPTSVPLHHFFTYLAKAELGKTPFFGVIARNLAVLVNRKSMESRKKSFTYMKSVLNEGISVFLYPEGTRNKTNDPLLPFFDGAFKLAKDMNVPLIVCTLVNMKKRNNINKMLDMCPGRLYCYIEEPIDVNNYSVEELKHITRTKMLERLTQK
jgi:1-acyl-sn-glycerol-3-phosphate acyltransferase